MNDEDYKLEEAGSTAEDFIHQRSENLEQYSVTYEKSVDGLLKDQLKEDKSSWD